jgi:predicted aspartyl protease
VLAWRASVGAALIVSPPDERTTRGIRVMLARAFLVIFTATGFAPADSGAAAGSCKFVRMAEWPVRLERNRVVVQGAINGQEIGILLDTGAGRSLIQRSAATRLGLTRRTAPGIRLFGIGGETYAETAVVEEFRIGQAVRKDWHVLVAGEQDVRANVGVIMGEDFLQNFDVEFDLAHSAVRLYQSTDCEGVSLAYWTPERAGELAMETGPKVHLTVQINGQPIRALLDSGATASVLDASDAGRLGVTAESPGVMAGGCHIGVGKKPVDSWIGKFETFSIGNETVRNPTIHFSDLWRHTTYVETGTRLPRNPAGLAQMLLGADFLLTHRVLIAYGQRKVYFSYVGGTVFPARPSKRCGEVTPKEGTTSGRGER